MHGKRTLTRVGVGLENDGKNPHGVIFTEHTCQRL